jgi:hypothetical protein
MNAAIHIFVLLIMRHTISEDISEGSWMSVGWKIL